MAFRMLSVTLRFTLNERQRSKIQIKERFLVSPLADELVDWTKIHRRKVFHSTPLMSLKNTFEADGSKHGYVSSPRYL